MSHGTSHNSLPTRSALCGTPSTVAASVEQVGLGIDGMTVASLLER
jgi:hypothetical protein